MSAESYESVLNRAASLCGVEPEFWDIFGHQHKTSEKTKQAIISALGIPTENREALERGILSREQEQWTWLVEPSHVAGIHQQPVRLKVHVPRADGDATLQIKLRREDGTARQFEYPLASAPQTSEAHVAGKAYVQKEITLGESLPLGYHDLHVTAGNLPPADLRLIIAPDRAYLPRFLEEGKKAAGIAVTLYGLRSAHNWGCGDFRDLRALCTWAAKEVGVSFIALNPLHAIHNRQPYNASPYLPNSIFYQNFIYLDLHAVEGFQQSMEAQELWDSPEVQREIRQLRATEFVEYERVHALKLRFLRLAFQWSCAHPDPWRALHFSSYVEQEGELLKRFATYCALDESLHRQNPDLWVWNDWPAGYQDPDSPETKRFQEEHAEDILFYQFIQWQLSRQLSEAQEHAKNSGMAIGLYHDLALATDRCGSDLWAHRPFYVGGCRVGAPPDDFSPQGQDWAFPPPNKKVHRADGYRLFAESIRKTCRNGGALRIDHVMRFFRLFWIADGTTAAEGTYVQDYWEDLLRILALESVRHQVLVIGEDLGTVEPEIRERLARFGILSYRLLYFERKPNGEYKRPEEYPLQALVSSTTHDLPTIAGFWTNQDIESRRKAGVLDDAGYHHQIQDRMREKQKMLDVLLTTGLLPHYVPHDAAHIPELTGELHNAIVGFLVSTPSMLMVMNQEDLTKEAAQQNLPGTTEQYRNWSKKMKFTIEQLHSDPQAEGYVHMFRHWLQRSSRS